MTAEELIKRLELEPLPLEGGFFRQTYCCPEKVPQEVLPGRYKKDMPYGTAIYAVLTEKDFSAMHILDTDEIYHFYGGDPLEMLLLYPDGHGEVFILGDDLAAGMLPQKVVPKDVYQGSHPVKGGQHGYSFIGTTMAPAFEWDDFNLAERDMLLEKYPDYADMINVRVR